MAAIDTDTVRTYRRVSTGFRPREVLANLWADKARLRRVLMIWGVAIVAGVALVTYLTGGRYVGTDDSYVRAAKLMVSTDVSGLVESVNVHQGQHVKKGDILFQLDAKPFEIAVANAQASVEQARLQVESQKATYRRDLEQVKAQQAQVNLDRVTFERYANLVKENAIAHTTYDQAHMAYLSSASTLGSLKQAADVDLAKLNGNPNLPAEQSPDYLKALAQLDEMKRQLGHSTVRAPFDGVVTEVDSLQPGTLVISAMSAFSTTSAVGLVSDQDVWVEANMKETDLTHVHAGQPVEITIDTYPGRTWKGVVQSISAASGSTFSPLPAENASGNWVKVVQRIPVRIAIERETGGPIIRAGMSTYISIDTGHRRWYRLLNN
jgi:membrane fusion protein (multidrug efflux system)